jgi:large subunit ribosomal protein L13
MDNRTNVSTKIMEYHIDAKDKILGRVATDIALILQGKKSAAYQRNRVSDDKVYVKNVDGIKVTGNKATDKIYYHHTGYVGHLKELSYEQKFAKDPRSVLRQAVRKMLPKNFLNQKRIKNLIFVEATAAATSEK